MGLLIGLDAREAFRENPRGIGLYCRHLIREFGAIAGEHRFLAYHERPVPADLPPLPANVAARRAPMRGGRFHLWERVRMPWQVRRDRLDVYHGTYNTLPPRLWGRRPRMVVSIHDLIATWWPDDAADPYVQYTRAVTARVIRDADAILTVSEWSKRDICERYRVPPAKVEIFWNGIHPVYLSDPPAEWAQDARRRFAGGRPYLYAIGASLMRKNTDGLIRALGVMKRRGRLHHLLVVSGVTGSTRERLEAQAAAAGVAADVAFQGYLAREELVGLYAGATLSVYPSFAEGWGIPVIESLAVGTPVATSNTTAMPEAGGEFAVYFDPKDPEHMAEVITAAIDAAPGFAARSADAKAWARRFTWRAAAEKTLAVYGAPPLAHAGTASTKAAAPTRSAS